MSRFSVKKPYTVVVAVIAVIIFGIISYRRMVPDLLPNMDYPYVIIVTTYPGAAPEEVETQVTRPMEQTMATLNNIKSLQSSSSENYSMLMLEFEQDTDMDSVTVDILQAVQQLTGQWNERIGTPGIIRINPSMLPVMVAAVDAEGMDRYELCQFAQDTLLQELEGTTGLASISTGGLVERTLTVQLNDDKLTETNERIEEAITESLSEARQQLEDAQKEIDDATAQVNYGLWALQNAPSTMMNSVTASTGDIEDKMAEYTATGTALAAAQAQQTALESERQLYLDRLQQLRDTQSGLEARLAAVQADRAVLAAAVQAEGADALPDDIALSDMGLPEETLAALTGMGCSTLGEARSMDRELAASEASLAAAVATAQVAAEEAQNAADLRLPELDSQLNSVSAQVEELQAQARAHADQIAQMQSGLDELPGQLLSGVTQMSIAGGQLAAAQSGLAQAQETLQQAYDSFDEQVQAALKAADMRSILTLETISSLIGAQNFDMPAGYVYEDGVSTIVTVGDGIKSIADLEELELFDLGLESMDSIRLRDVADVVAADNADEIYATLNGNNGLLLTFTKQSNYATAQVADNLRDKFAELSEKYPGISFTPLMDQGEYIYLIRDSILSSLLWGALFSVLILFLFLRDWRPTVITLCSIPISLLFAMTLMYFSHVSINIMSLSGLAISVGMLVDNSIVVIENTYRLRALGESSIKAAVSGARQVAGAVAASTLTTVCVFVPIAFVQGLTRALFTDMVLTLSYALLASLAVAVTLVPAMASRLLRKEKPRREGWMARVTRGYRGAVLWGVRYKALVLLLAVALLLGSGALVLQRGYSFMPEMEMEQMMVTLTAPEGTAFAGIVEMADEAERRMLEVDGVATVGGTIGDSYGIDLSSFSSGGDVTYYVLLSEDTNRKAREVAAEINERCADMDCVVNADSNSIMSSMMTAVSGSGVTLRLFSSDLDALQEGGRLAAERLAQVEGIGEVSTGEEDPSPEIHLVVDKAKAIHQGLTVAQVYMEVAKAITGSAELMTLTDDGATYTVIVRTMAEEDISPEYLMDLEFTVTDSFTKEERTVALSDIAAMERTETLSTIRRLEQRRYLDVTGTVAEGYNITRTADRVEEALADLELPEGVELSFAGERESIMDALGDLLLLLLVGVILVYLVMVAQFQNLKSPFIVMFTIPLAFTGGFLALYLFGMELSILSMLGMIMLVGIIVNNGIVLVDYINQLREGGMERREAIAEAAVTRVRPILMTSITTILGLIVMALGQNEATSLIQPLAVTCIGGLIYATLMTLFVVPVMYDMLAKRAPRHIAEEELELSTL